MEHMRCLKIINTQRAPAHNQLKAESGRYRKSKGSFLLTNKESLQFKHLSKEVIYIFI